MDWHNLAIIDVETTGMHPQHDRIIEIGIALVDHNRITFKYSQLINPQTYLPPEITVLTGILPQDIEHQPTFPDLAADIQEYLKDRLLIAHNVRFDYSFLKSEYSRLGETLTLKHLCSARLSRALFPRYRHHSLDAILDRFQLKCLDRHRALGDALVIFDFLKLLPQHHPVEKITAAVNRLTRTPALPLNLKPQIIKSLPTCPGVYIFYDRACPLYVGKSLNLKSRILDHFYSDLDSARELHLKDQLTDIETLPTAGELSALLLESELVKQLQPVYNRQLRLHQELLGLKLVPNKEGYLTVTTERLKTDKFKPAELYGVFRSERNAKTTVKQLVGEHQLCWKLTGLEKNAGACFGYHLDECRGACLGKEPPAAYNLRVIEAFSRHKLLSWPFSGPIRITEHNDLNGQTETLQFNHWCQITPQPHHFDLDTYHILKRFITSHSDRCHVL